jgi:MurNAc alpha-1-phosphate uridylyltransferase
VLAAGAGARLRPLTTLCPKALCPVNNVALVDLALARVQAVTSNVAVNVHHGRAALVAHLAGRAHLSIEEPEALGTAGALGYLREWIDGRSVLVVNADAWIQADLAAFVQGWDRDQVRVMVVADESRRDFRSRDGRWWRYAGAALMPWSEVCRLRAEPTGLYECSWRQAEAEGRLDLAPHAGPFFDCGTPVEYLAANLHVSGGRSVIGPGAVVEGEVDQSVVWPDGVVRRGERLVRAIRAVGPEGEPVTVQVD